MHADSPKNPSPAQLDERFELLAADAREYALVLLDHDGALLCWNPGAERLFGFSAPEIIGQHFSRFFTPEDIRSGQPEYELKTALSAGRFDSARWQIRKDGSRFWGQATVTPLRDRDKQIHSFARVVHDLTESQAQDAQKKRGDDLAQANRNIEEFMALLSHELRNPLAPILNALSILKQVRTNDPIIEQAGSIINRQVVQMVRLVDDLLDISRITKGKLRLTKERLDLRIVANRAAESTRPLMDARKHDFSISLPTQSVFVDADPSRMEQIVVNLLNNAAKYTDVGGLIRMSVEQDGNEAVIHVRDNGVGIAAAMLPKIFDLFTQVDGTLSRSYGGLGIGLALVRTLVELQDGRVQAQSAGLGKGSEFTVKLPAVGGVSLTEPSTVLAAIKRPERPLRILIAEDNVDSADSMSLLLRLYGHEVHVARTGPTAVEMAVHCRPDVMLLDIGLPGMDGYEVARTLRDRPEFKHVTICALTGYTPSDADRQRQAATGFDHHFVKPIRLEVLIDLFKSVAKQPLLRDENCDE